MARRGIYIYIYIILLLFFFLNTFLETFFTKAHLAILRPRVRGHWPHVLLRPQEWLAPAATLPNRATCAERPDTGASASNGCAMQSINGDRLWHNMYLDHIDDVLYTYIDIDIHIHIHIHIHIRIRIRIHIHIHIYIYICVCVCVCVYVCVCLWGLVSVKIPKLAHIRLSQATRSHLVDWRWNVTALSKVQGRLLRPGRTVHPTNRGVWGVSPNKMVGKCGWNH